MADNKMLIDATHPEETRVVVLRDGRVEEFDYESAARKLLRGNIYLAKVTRVEPALQAAFVDYGGNRHGFLAFNEIHPDYYQIPIADRQALIDEEAEAEALAEAEVDARAERNAKNRSRRSRGSKKTDAAASDADAGDNIGEDDDDGANTIALLGDGDDVLHGEDALDDRVEANDNDIDDDADEDQSAVDETYGDDTSEEAPLEGEVLEAEAEPVEDVGTAEDALEELPSRPRRSRRSYKIQEVIKRRQVILIQVVKEERGNKGAALTTYLSLAGRYTVLMPNTARGGGISRKITNPQDRKRLKAIAHDLEVPEGMGLIIRTAGAARTKQEIRRDFEYLLRLWESVRDMTLDSTAPALVYEEGNLIKRSIRDLYNKEVDEVLVAGNHAYHEAKSFMRMLMPSHAKNVTHYKDAQPLFTRFQIERQLNAMFSPFVTLKSGGYLVINQTEALVAVDVNSGKSTREFSIEETAVNTNLEAAEETARQLRLRDLAGLIVIDFIDMDERRNNRAVERCMKESLKHDRARIQVGRISHFGLLEMSRQRLRTGVLEGSTTPCAHCQGTGIVRSTESVALAVIRGLEDAVMAGGRHALIAKTTPTVALYILNNKRDFINEMEVRHGLPIAVEGSDKVQGANFTIDKGAVQAAPQRAVAVDKSVVSMDWGFEDETDGDAGEGDNAVAARSPSPRSSETDGEEGERPRRRRRRGRRGRGSARGDDASASERTADTEEEVDNEEIAAREGGESLNGEDDDKPPRRRRRRGRRGGRRTREREAGEIQNGVNADSNGDAMDGAFVAADSGDDSTEPSQQASTASTDVDAQSEIESAARPRPRRRSPRSRSTTPENSADGIAVTDAAASDEASFAPPQSPAADVGISAAMSSIGEAVASVDETPRAAAIEQSPPTVSPKEPETTEPSAPQQEAKSTESPRRGWWQRRILGDE